MAVIVMISFSLSDLSFTTARQLLAVLISVALYFGLSPAYAGQILLQSTTSTQNSGLYDYLLPLYEAEMGETVIIVAVGTGKALFNGRNCNADALLIHSTKDEEEFVKDGFGLYRQNVMYNDFILVGPSYDPAQIKNATNAGDAFRKIASEQASFASRGDNSGTHKKEIALWEMAAINPVPHSGTWYLETGTGMGATLNLAVEKNAYSITDRGTWIAFANKQQHEILFEGDSALFNQYGIIPIATKACPSAKQDLAVKFANWLASDNGQKAIASFTKNGEQLFMPNAD